MQIDKELFEFGRRKAAGFVSAKARTLAVSDEEHDKAYLNDLGSEVHVNGPKVANLDKPESLREKIARFDALAARVRESRAIMSSLAGQLESDDDDEDLLDIEDGDDFDEFGEIIEKPNLSTSPDDGDVSADKPAAPQQAGPASEPEKEPSEEGE